MLPVSQIQFFGVMLLIVMMFEFSAAERRYCGLALTKKLMSVCDATDCSQVSKTEDGNEHADEISTRCCRFGCSVSHMEQFCCLSASGSSKSEPSTVSTTTVAPEETPFKPKRHSKTHHSTQYYKDLKFKQMKRAMEKWAEFESELETLV